MRSKFYVIILILIIPCQRLLASESFFQWTSWKDWNPVHYKRFSQFHDNYFLFEMGETKVQLSIKYEIVPQFFAGYSAQLYWDLLGPSNPINETVHEPVFFYQFNFKKNPVIEGVRYYGLYHMSNGEEGEIDRWFNGGGLEILMKTEIVKGVDIFIKPMLIYPYNMSMQNTDLMDYMGYLKTSIGFLFKFDRVVDQLKLNYNFHTSKKMHSHYSQELTIALSFKIKKYISPAFYFEIYDGTLEGMINYKEKSTRFRGGAGFHF